MNNNDEVYFPYKKVYGYLQDIKLREKIIVDNLKLISLSRETIEKLLKCANNS